MKKTFHLHFKAWFNMQIFTLYAEWIHNVNDLCFHHFYYFATIQMHANYIWNYWCNYIAYSKALYPYLWQSAVNMGVKMKHAKIAEQSKATRSKCPSDIQTCQVSISRMSEKFVNPPPPKQCFKRNKENCVWPSRGSRGMLTQKNFENYVSKIGWNCISWHICC